MRVECIASESGIERLLPEWAELWRHAPEATPFQSPAWLVPWWRHYGTGMPRLLTAWAGNVLIGVLPLYELHEPGVRKLLPIGIGLSDYIDALVDPAMPVAGDLLLTAIAEIPDWDECYLPDLPPGGVLESVACPPTLVETRQRTEPCPVLVLPSDIGALAAVVPKKTLRDVRQGLSRCAAAGGITIETADADTLAGFLDDLFRLHGKRWHERGEPGVLADPQVRAFHHDAARALAGAGLLRLYRLRIGGAVAAAYYGFLWRNRAYAYIGGFDPDMQRLSPGAQILQHAIGAAIAEGCTEFHFLRGGESYKYAWGAADRWNGARSFRRR